MRLVENQTSYWDRVARRKVFTHPVETDLLRAHVASPARILDYGCGYGRVAAQLTGAGYGRVVGVDSSRGMLDRARDESPELALAQIDGLRSPFGAGVFDAVLLFSVLNCIPARERQVELMTEIERLLRPGGVFYLSDLALQQDPRRVERYRRALPRYGEYGVFELEEGVVLRHLDPEWVAQLTAGFEILTRREFEVCTMNDNTAEAFQLLGRKQ